MADPQPSLRLQKLRAELSEIAAREDRGDPTDGQSDQQSARPDELVELAEKLAHIRSSESTFSKDRAWAQISERLALDDDGV